MFSRPSRDTILMDSARLWSSRSTCSRLGVGAVFAREGRILVTGYNGAPAGLPHCNHKCDCHRQEIEGQWDDEPRHFDGCNALKPCIISEHAERNGIAWAARHGVRLGESEVFITHMPCLPCAMSLINVGVVRVVYDEPYRDSAGVGLLRQANVVVDQWNHV